MNKMDLHKEKCIIHNENCVIYCIQCSRFLCYRCEDMHIIWRSSVKSHKFILNEALKYTDSITCDSSSWQDIYYYTRTFETTMVYSICQIRLSVPLVGNSDQYSMSRIIMYLDDEELCDGSSFSNYAWVLSPLNLIGVKEFLQIGKHRVRISACVRKPGCLFIPAYGSGHPNAPLTPIIQGRYLIEVDE